MPGGSCRGQLTDSMDQSPSCEADKSTASQESLRILRNPKVHYFIHKCAPPVTILSHSNPAHASPSHFLKIHFNIILPSMPRSSKWSLFLKTPHQPCMHLSFLPYMPRPAHLILDLTTRIVGEEYNMLLSSLITWSPLTCYLIPLRPKYPLQHPKCSNILSVCVSLNVRDQALCPYKTIGKITVQYTEGKKVLQ